jgi:FixJ family two-component response regulator
MMKTEPDFAKLTRRQREVLDLLARRLSNSELAKLLQLVEAITEIDMAAIRMCFHRADGVVQFPGAPRWNGGHRPDDGAGLPAA